MLPALSGMLPDSLDGNRGQGHRQNAGGGGQNARAQRI